MTIEPFELPYSQNAVDDLRARLASTRWADQIPNAEWEYGLSADFLREICTYWRERFDWKLELQKLAALNHFRCSVDGIGVHFIHQRGNGPRPIPLIITHGWPGSFLEMLKLLPMLADPARFGAEPEDAFDIVVPSLPGFGFSDRPQERGVNLFRIGDMFAILMRELGYDRFGAQGGDFGAGVSTVLGLRHPDHVIGVHLNYVPGSYRPFLDSADELLPEEKTFLAEAEQWYTECGGYAHIQRTHPQTAAYGLNDSPTGLAAWILEKFRDWSDCGGDLYTKFTRDELLSNVTLYWMTETIHSSFRLYYETRKAPLHFQREERVKVPCAIARFPKEAPFPPRAWVERGYRVAQWTEMPSGGHFAAAEEPEMLARDIRRFFKRLRP